MLGAYVPPIVTAQQEIPTQETKLDNFSSSTTSTEEIVTENKLKRNDDFNEVEVTSKRIDSSRKKSNNDDDVEEFRDSFAEYQYHDYDSSEITDEDYT